MRWFYKMDWFIVFTSMSLSLLGIFVLFGSGGSGEILAYKKLVWLVLGVLAMLLFANINYQTLGSYSLIMYGVGILLLIVTLLFAPRINGARAWIRIGPFGIQTSELMKIALIFALSKYLLFKEKDIGKVREMIVPFFITAVPLVLIAIQPDLGYAVLIIPILFVMLFIGGANAQVLAALLIIGFSTLFVPMYMEYQKFILVDDIVTLLKKEHLQLAESVRVLNFEVWHFLDNPASAKAYAGSSLKWAIEAVTSRENLETIRLAIREIRAAHPVWLRDFFLNTTAVMVMVGVTGFLALVFFIIHFTRNLPWARFFSVAFLIISLATLTVFVTRSTVSFKPHQVIRIISFANPDKFPKRSGYQLRHSLITVGSGKIFGKGMFQSDMTRGDVPFLPEWHNDFIFSVVGEQFGLIGTLVTLFLLFGLILRSAMIALQSKDDFGTLLASGITALFFFHTAFNVGITLGLLPVTGIPLIFVSYGGSNMLASFICAGVLINIHKRKYINS